MNIRLRMMLLAVFSILPSIFFIFYLNLNDTAIYIWIRKSSDGFTKYYPASTVGTLTSSGYTTTVALIEDTTA